MATFPFSVSGADLEQWRKAALAGAIAAQVEPSELDWFLQAVSNLDRLTLKLNLVAQQLSVGLRMPFGVLQSKWQQRLQDRVPLQYLVGLAPWRHFELIVTPDVLIPRPETECVIDYVQGAIAQNPTLAKGDWVDLGTGSGAIAIGLADLLPQAKIHAVDLSPAALAIAQRNAERLHLHDRIQFYQGSWFEPLQGLQGQLKGMVSNPPYIPSQEVLALQPEVVGHEPHLALDGGEDGLDAIQHLIQTAPDYLQSGGIWLVEMMAGQGEAVVEALAQQGDYCKIALLKDLEGIDRFAIAQRR
ncbi:peptide chain release factor N(5)-glutamine methyltransferase [Alkalinema pantanalense CENA528]|uniref:peptide chain release factor N(5)-glutamine methyltransferase n=1 Tax=Alkalinema pantanalense TaxID=1620705 RepID=UPI003D6E96C9